MLDYHSSLSHYVNITEGKIADNKGAETIPLTPGSVVVADRYYNDFPLLNIWDSNKMNFVIRHKINLQYRVIKKRELPKNHAQHVLVDQEIELLSVQSHAKYPKKLRRVVVWDEKNQQLYLGCPNHW